MAAQYTVARHPRDYCVPSERVLVGVSGLTSCLCGLVLEPTIARRLPDEADFLQRGGGFLVFKLEEHRFFVTVLNSHAGGWRIERERLLK